MDIGNQQPAEYRERESLLEQAKKKVRTEDMTLSFTIIDTEEQAQNVYEILKQERRKVVIVSQSVDMATFRPKILFVAVKQDETLFQGLRYSMSYTGDVADKVAKADFTSTPWVDLSAVKNVLEKTHDVEGDDYKFAGYLSLDSVDFKVDAAAQRDKSSD